MNKVKKGIFTAAISLSLISSPIAASAEIYTVKSGDTYWKISEKFNVDLQRLMDENNAGENHVLYVGQKINIPESYEYYVVQQGETLWKISQKLGVSLQELITVNNISENAYIYVGQRLKIPSSMIQQRDYTYYTVQQGDTPWIISQKLGVSLDKLMSMNNLNESSVIYVGQKFKIPITTYDSNVVEYSTSSKSTFIPQQPNVEITYIEHQVEKGENFWSISMKYGLELNELLKVNNANSSTVLNIGDVVKIPVYKVGVMETPGEEFGEYLDWWEAARYLIPIGSEFKVIDFYTGKWFYAKRTTGANHADCETISLEDTNRMKEIWGGSFSWRSRPVIIEYNGRRIAASASSMPHAGNDSDPGGQYTDWRSDDYGPGTNYDFIKGNGMDGHFDIHFFNSTRHKDGQLDEYHQKNVKIAAGIDS